MDKPLPNLMKDINLEIKKVQELTPRHIAKLPNAKDKESISKVRNKKLLITYKGFPSTIISFLIRNLGGKKGKEGMNA